MKKLIIFLILTTILTMSCSKNEPEPQSRERIRDHFWATPHREIIRMSNQILVHHQTNFPKNYVLDEYDVEFFLFGSCVISLQAKISNTNAVWISIQGTQPDLFYIGDTIDFEWVETAAIKSIDTKKHKVKFVTIPYKERTLEDFTNLK